MTHRLFTGIALPQEIRGQVEALQTASTDSGLQWQHPRNFHLTLNFIGNVETDRMAALTEALARVQCRAFSLHLSGAGYFGSHDNPRVLWAGVVDSEPLHSLQQQTLKALQVAGFRPDDRRPYHPHVTLARCQQQAAPAVSAWLRRQADFRSPSFHIEQFELFESMQDASGLVYRIMDRFRLRTDR